MSFKNFAIVAVAMCAFSCSDFDNDFKDSEGYELMGWSLGSGTPATSGNITVTEKMQLTVTFKKKEPVEPQQPEEASKKRVHRRK